MKKEITWTTGTKQQAIVTITLTTERILGYSELEQRDIVKPDCSIHISATIDGKSAGGLGNIQKIDHPVAVAKIGKLAMTQVNYDRVLAACAEVEASDYVQAWRAKEADAAKLDAEFEAHNARVDAMMRMGE